MVAFLFLVRLVVGEDGNLGGVGIGGHLRGVWVVHGDLGGGEDI